MSLLLEDLEVRGQLPAPLQALPVEVGLLDAGIGLGGYLGILEVLGTGEGGHVGVGVGALHGDVEQLAGEDVARAVEAACEDFLMGLHY